MGTRYITRSQLGTDLAALDLADGDTIMLHASVKAIGWVVEGPDVVLQSILDVIGSSGSLMMYIKREDAPDDPAYWSPERGKAVALGRSPGYVLAEDTSDPAWAIIYVYGLEGFYLASRTTEVPIQTMKGALAHESASTDTEWVEISGCSPGLDRSIEKFLDGSQVEKASNRIYRLATLPDPSPTNSAIHLIDDQLVSCPPCDISPVLDRIHRFWRSTDTYLCDGAGACLITDGQVAAICLSAFVLDNAHLLDIETRPPFRRKGFGKTVGHACIEAVVGRGGEVHWACMSTNSGSRRLIESFGGTLIDEYTLYSCRWTHVVDAS